MLTPISLDFGLSSSPDNLLPDTSGLATLSLPEKFLSEHNDSRPPPSPDAIHRFQSALSGETDAPSPLALFSRAAQLSAATRQVDSDLGASPVSLPQEPQPVALPSPADTSAPSRSAFFPSVQSTDAEKPGESNVSVSDLPLQAPRVATPLREPSETVQKAEDKPPQPLHALPITFPASLETPLCLAGTTPVSPPESRPVAPVQSTSLATDGRSRGETTKTFVPLADIPEATSKDFPRMAQSPLPASPSDASSSPVVLRGLDTSSVMVAEKDGALPNQEVPSTPNVIPIASAHLSPLDVQESRIPAFSLPKTGLVSPEVSIPAVPSAVVPPEVGLTGRESGPRLPEVQPGMISSLAETTPRPRPVDSSPQPQRSQMNPIPASDATAPAIQLASLLPDTSDLAPLSLPAEFLSRFQTLPDPDAVRRFQSAFSDSVLPRESASQEIPPVQLPSAPLYTIPLALAGQRSSSATPPSSLDSSPLPPPSVSDSALSVPALSSDLAQKSDQLGKAIASYLENIPQETIGHREIGIALPTDILDASTVVLTSKDDTLVVTLRPSSPASVSMADAILPHLSEALQTRLADDFPHVQVVLSPVAVPDTIDKVDAPADPISSIPPFPLQAAPFSAPLPFESSSPAPESGTPAPVSPVHPIATSPETTAQNRPRVDGPPNVASEEIDQDSSLSPSPSTPLVSLAPQATPVPAALSSATLDAMTSEISDALVSQLGVLPALTSEPREIPLLLPDVPSAVLTATDHALLVTLRLSASTDVSLADALLPRLSEILSARIPSFSQVEVVLTPSAVEAPATLSSSTVSAVVPPPADLAEQATQLAEILFSRFDSIPAATLEHGEIRIPLPSSLLDASSVVVTAKDGMLLVTVEPSRQDTAPLASAFLPRVVEVLEPRLQAFRNVQVTVASPDLSLSSTSSVTAPPDEADKALEPSSEIVAPPLQALPVSSPAPLEMQLSPSVSDPQGSQPVSPVHPSTPVPGFSSTSVPSREANGSRESDDMPPVAEFSRPLAGTVEEQVVQTPSMPLQALPFAAPAPLETSVPSPTLQPLPGSLSPSFPAMPAESPSRSTVPIFIPGNPSPSLPPESAALSSIPPPSRTVQPTSAAPLSGNPAPFQAAPLDIPAHAASPVPIADPSTPTPPAPQTLAARPDIPQPANQPTDQSANYQTFKPSNLQTIRPPAPSRDNPAPLQAAPVDVPPPAASPVPLADPAAVASAASARTASIAETVDQIASAVAARILVTPSLAAGGDGEIHITLQPAILDGSTVTLTATNGTLAVAVVPATAEAAAVAAAALPQLAAAMEAHAPAFRRVQVSLATKKGNPDETV